MSETRKQTIGALAELFELTTPPDASAGTAARSFNGVGVRAFAKVIDAFRRSDKALAETVSDRDLRGMLVTVATAPSASGDGSKLYASLKSSIEAIPVEPWLVSRPFWGAFVDQGSYSNFGHVGVWQPGFPPPSLPAQHAEDATKMLKREVEEIENAQRASRLPDHVIIATTQIQGVRTFERALELADQRFEQFDNILQYMLRAFDRAEDAGVIDFRSRKMSHFVASSDTTHSRGGSVEGAVQAVDLRLPYFQDEAVGNARVWTIFAKADRSSLEKRILTAIEWIGKARHDRDPSKSFVQWVFALEALLHHRERGEFLSPSIAYGIGEAAAFILGSSAEKREAITKDVSAIYNERSTLVHGGGAGALNEAVANAARGLVSHLLVTLPTDQRFASCTKLEEVLDWTRKFKFRDGP